MADLTHEQAAVICRVPDMPVSVKLPQYDEWFTDTRGNQHFCIHANLHYEYRLTPGAPLTAQQAAICLAMGVAVEVESAVLMTGEDGESTWRRVYRFGPFWDDRNYRVPEASE